MADLNSFGLDFGFLNFLSTGLVGSVGATIMAQPLLALGIGIGLIILTILLFLFIKKIILNSIIGLVLFLILKIGFGISVPFVPAFVLSVIFGPAGLGVIIVLKFFGVSI